MFTPEQILAFSNEELDSFLKAAENDERKHIAILCLNYKCLSEQQKAQFKQHNTASKWLCAQEKSMLMNKQHPHKTPVAFSTTDPPRL